ncbi:MAG: prepilin-type N-terminal cleavage/methylation domain-containing protein [Verrucomicrobiota bacterium]
MKTEIRNQKSEIRRDPSPVITHHSLRSAFTLVELLVVIAIIAILAAILLPAMNAAMKQGEKAQAVSEVKSVETAVKAYLNEYSKFPTGNGIAADYSYGGLGGYVNNRELMNVLRSIDAAPNTGYVFNPRKIVFLEVAQGSLTANGDFTDPWGNQYEITADTGFDNTCNNMKGGYTTVANRNVVVWSRGPDGTANTSDDIRSWQ